MNFRFCGLFVVLCGIPGFAATVTVSTTAQLLAAVQNASAGDTVLLSDGTYAITDSGSGIGLLITKGIAVKSINGPSKVTVTANTSYIAIQVRASNASVEGITVSGAQWGVQATAVSNVLIRNVVASTVGNGGQTFGFQGTTNSVFELCTANNSYNHGFSISTGANYNLVINNVVNGTQAGDGVAVVTSDHNIVVGNTINNTYFDGVTLNGSQYNYVALNKINMPHNGVTVTKDTPPSGRQSIGNYVGNNTLALNPANAAGGSDGIWFDYDSNYNMAYGNDASASQENGMAIFNSIGNYVRGNVFHGNPQGGLFVWNSAGSSGFTTPAYNSIQQNYFYRHAANGGVTLDNAANTDISFNYIAGDPAQIGTPIAGFLFRSATSATTAVGNVIRDLLQGEQINGTTLTTSLYLNRHFNTPNHYTFSPATINWDSGSAALGGNFFSDFTAANGNPSPGTTPYSNIIYDNAANKGLYKDNYPYKSESLGRQYSVAAVLPAAGSYFPVGSLKTVSWTSQACVMVDLTLVNGATSIALATNLADYGNFRMTVPAVAAGFYAVRIDCKDSGGASVLATATTNGFNVTPADLVLLSPQSNQMLDAGGTTLISWAKTANVTLPVDIYFNGGLLVSGITADYYSLTTPATSSAQNTVRIVSGAYSDSTDGSFTTRSGSTGFFSIPASGTSPYLYAGSAYPVEWVAPVGTAYVDIDLVTGSGTKNVATRLADFSRYVVPVPALYGAGAYFRLTSHNVGGTVLNTAQSTAVTVAPVPVMPVTIAVNASTTSDAYTYNFKAIVRDANAAAVPNASVTFTAPASGATGSFHGTLTCFGTTQCTSWTVTTDSAGVATAPAFVTNGTVGSYNVVAASATAPGTSAVFSVTNVASLPSIVINSGNYQYSVAGNFANPLKVLVRDSASNPIAGASVVFTAPGSGASGTFLGTVACGNAATPCPSWTVTTDASGIATSPALRSNANPGAFNVTATYTAGGVSTSLIEVNAAQPTSAALYFVPITPCRVVDTRNAAGAFGGPAIGGGTTRNFTLPSGACGIPATAQAYSMNVAVVPQAQLGYLTLWPAGQTQPYVATLNSDGRVKSNAAIVPAGTGGAVSVFASNTTDVILDVNGYYLPATANTGLQFYPVAPCRMADTRNANGPLGGPYIAGSVVRSFPLSGNCGVPAGAQAYSLNFAAVPRGSLGYLTAWPAGQTQPLAATLNALTGTVTANAGIVPAGTGGAISVFASNDTDLVIDVNGYYAAPGGAGALSMYTITPFRAFDSRTGSGQPLSGTYNLNVTAVGGPPPAQAIIFNATVVPSGTLGYITLWPQGGTQPNAASLNATDGAVTGNMAIVPIASGAVNIFFSNPTHIIMDVFGYYAP